MKNQTSSNPLMIAASIILGLAGIALALEFKMGGEVLRTVVVREWAELGILGAIIVLRGALTFLIHWEIKNEEKALEKKDMKKKQSVRRRKRPSEDDLPDIDQL